MNSHEQHQETAGDPEPAEPYISNRLLTVPNLLCVIRLVGSFVLIAIAWLDQQEVFLWFFLFLAMTDWLDGKLAILLNQRSVFGARLDSWADATLYAALLVGTVMMYGATLRSELAWIIPALTTYLISTAAGLWKYQRWPSYHTPRRQDLLASHCGRGDRPVHRLVPLAPAHRPRGRRHHQSRSSAHHHHFPNLARRRHIHLPCLAGQ